MGFKNAIAEELKSRARRKLPDPPKPTPFQVMGGWASPEETDDDPYVAEGDAIRAGADVLAQLYRQQGRM